jgi:hypothetical protein
MLAPYESRRLSVAAKPAPRGRSSRRRRRPSKSSASKSPALGSLLALIFSAGILGACLWLFSIYYTVGLQSPLLMHLQWPLVVEEKIGSEDAEQARADQHGRPLSAWQEYACRKFGSDCRVALAIQRAENPQGKCEIYHYNSDGTLDWGYFQINTVHLKRPGLNLRDLLGCKSNIDFAYQLFQEKGGFTPWSTYNSDKYRQFLTQ